MGKLKNRGHTGDDGKGPPFLFPSQCPMHAFVSLLLSSRALYSPLPIPQPTGKTKETSVEDLRGTWQCLLGIRGWGIMTRQAFNAAYTSVFYCFSIYCSF